MKTPTKPGKKKAAATLKRAARFGMEMKPFGDVPNAARVRFGGVTVVLPKPEPANVKKQIASGEKAAARLTKKVASPGVRIVNAANAPVFRADPRNPALVIRVLKGKTTRGHFVQGRFVETP